MPPSARRVLLGKTTASPDLEDRFFAAVRLPNGTFKTTTRHRLDDLNALLLKCLRDRDNSAREVLDIGVSSGVSTAELAEVLRQAGFASQLLGADLCVHAFVAEVAPSFWVLVDRDANPLQFDLLGRGWRPWRRRLDFVTGYVAISRVLGLWYEARQRSRVRQAIDQFKSAGRAALMTIQPVDLVSPAATAAGVRFCEDDVLVEPAPELRGRFDVIRAANLLNRAYFTPPELRQAVQGLGARLRGPGALVAVCRTVRKRGNHGSIFLYRGAQRFEQVAILGEGSEVAEYFA